MRNVQWATGGAWYLAVAGIALGSLFGVEAAGAEDLQALPGVSFDEEVITATRGRGSAFDAAFMVDVVDQTDIAERGYRTLPDALRYLPGVMIQKTSNAQGSPYIRGFTGRDNLLMIDGVRLNNSTFRGGPVQYWNTIDPLTIDRMEVVKGPSSVLYGSDAIGGTVNVITKSPYTYGEGFGYGATGYYRLSSAENSHTGRGELSATFDQTVGLLFGGTGKHFGDLIGGDDVGRQPNTGYDEYDTDFKAEWYLNPDTRLVAAHQRVRQNNAPRTHRTDDAVSYHGTTVGTDRRHDFDQQRELTYLQFHSENLEGPVQAIHASLSYHLQEQVLDRIRSSGARSLEGYDVGSLGFWAQLESNSPIGKLTYGVEYYHDEVDSFSTTNAIQGPVGDNASYDLLGLYLQDEIPVCERLSVILGGRYTFAAAEAGSVEDPVTGDPIRVERDFDAWVGSARAVYELVPDSWNVYGGISQGFRAPNLDDLTNLKVARTNEQAIPSPNVDPEYYVAYEIGTKARNKDAAIEVAYFFTDIQDAIVRAPTGGVTPGGDLIVGSRNGAQGHVQGVELGASWRFVEQLTLFGNVTWQEGEIDSYPFAGMDVKVRDHLSRVMPLTGQVGLRWDKPTRDMWAEIQVVMADKADKLSTGDIGDTSRIPAGGTPGYAVVNLRGGWRVHDQVTLTLALENLGDVDYRVHGSGSNEAGFNAVLGVEMRF